ncbi:MAG: MATE family efflux transporter [Mogibacterium sp.]|nr:MATE family efflux transporter [Mogibacterium sp.]
MSEEKKKQAGKSGIVLTKERGFYRTLLTMLVTVALQNLVAYSVNMADNLMLGSYSQNALSGAATVNQIFFMVQHLATGISTGLSVLTAQYWGAGRSDRIRSLSAIGIRIALVLGSLSVILCIAIPEPLLRLFTNDTAIIAEGLRYLALIRWTFLLFLITNILIAVLRSVEVVRISFYISLISLIVNVGFNYCLIFGHFGCPELGIRGAAVGTLIGRILELAIVLYYVLRIDHRICFRLDELVKFDRNLRREYLRIGFPVVISTVLWAVSVPMQTAILGHMSSEAIAANSVATTFYQYAKVIVSAMTSVSSVLIGKTVGRGDFTRVRAEANSLQIIYFILGLLLSLLIFLIRIPLLSVYQLTASTKLLADHLMIIMSGIMLGMAYQVPLTYGILQGAGDTHFTMALNISCTWLITMPLSFLAAFVWKLPIEAVVLCIQADQVWKGIPAFLRYRGSRWIRQVSD